MFVPADRCIGHKRAVNIQRKKKQQARKTVVLISVMTSAVYYKSTFSSTDAVYIILWFRDLARIYLANSDDSYFFID